MYLNQKKNWILETHSKNNNYIPYGLPLTTPNIIPFLSSLHLEICYLKNCTLEFFSQTNTWKLN
jgi:hypothetical protein